MGLPKRVVLAQGILNLRVEHAKKGCVEEGFHIASLSLGTFGFID